MIDTCEGCCKQVFADNWVDFINWYIEHHPEFIKDYELFQEEVKKLPKCKTCGHPGLINPDTMECDNCYFERTEDKL